MNPLRPRPPSTCTVHPGSLHTFHRTQEKRRDKKNHPLIISWSGDVGGNRSTHPNPRNCSERTPTTCACNEWIPRTNATALGAWQERIRACLCRTHCYSSFRAMSNQGRTEAQNSEGTPELERRSLTQATPPHERKREWKSTASLLSNSRVGHR